MLKECPKSYMAYTSEMNLRKGNQSFTSIRLKNKGKKIIQKTQKMKRIKLHITKQLKSFKDQRRLKFATIPIKLKKILESISPLHFRLMDMEIFNASLNNQRHLDQFKIQANLTKPRESTMMRQMYHVKGGGTLTFIFRIMHAII